MSATKWRNTKMKYGALFLNAQLLSPRPTELFSLPAAMPLYIDLLRTDIIQIDSEWVEDFKQVWQKCVTQCKCLSCIQLQRDQLRKVLWKQQLFHKQICTFRQIQIQIASLPNNSQNTVHQEVLLCEPCWLTGVAQETFLKNVTYSVRQTALLCCP